MSEQMSLTEAMNKMAAMQETENRELRRTNQELAEAVNQLLGMVGEQMISQDEKPKRKWKLFGGGNG